MPDSVEHVMVADGSGVFFQRDPFDLSRRYGAAELLFFGDRGDRFPRASATSASGSTSAPTAGASCWAQCRARSAASANGGIFLGSRRAVLSLAEEVVRSAEACGYWESDQGLVNYAVPRGGAAGRDKSLPGHDPPVSMGHYAWPYTRQHKNNLQIYCAKVAPWLSAVG
ncbi:hypothetical protein JL720_7 [Aureococcus anophagefferens]|nr:hypothetical protein JL720_7 [Aureococcus anophagefferens]